MHSWYDFLAFMLLAANNFTTYLGLKPSVQELNAERAKSVKNSIFWEERGEGANASCEDEMEK